MAIWQIPKTDWTAEDRFNYKDYNRIRNNLLYLHDEVSKVWGDFDIEYMGAEIESYRADWKAEYFNAFETNIDTINKNMFTQDYGFRQTFYPNGIFISFSELNRIESAILSMKQIIEGKIAGQRRLPFRCGSPKGLIA